MTYVGSTAMYESWNLEDRHITVIYCTFYEIAGSEQVNHGAIVRVAPFCILPRRCADPDDALEPVHIIFSQPIPSKFFRDPLWLFQSPIFISSSLPKPIYVIVKKAQMKCRYTTTWTPALIS